MRKRAAPRLLARGNREIFVEIASQFAALHRDVRRARRRVTTAAGSGTGRRSSPSPATELFPAADIDLLRDGLESYYEAMFETDVRRQAELVLRGNILLADYEQQRVDPIVRCALSLFPSRLLEDDADEGPLLVVRDKKPWALAGHRRRSQRDRPDVLVDRHEVAHGDRPARRRVAASCRAS